MIKTIISLIAALPKLLDFIKGIFGMYSKWKEKRDQSKMDAAVKKAKDKKNTEDMQKEIGKTL